MKMKKRATRERVVSALMMAAVVACFCVTRFFRLDSLPEGLHIDEVGLGYDALCLSKYGVDRYLEPWPLYMINAGGGSSILYTYLCTLFLVLVKKWVGRPYKSV